MLCMDNIKSVTIKKMTADDVDKIIAIESEAYGEHHWSKDSFLNEIHNELARYYTLFTSSGEIAGYAGTWHILDEIPESFQTFCYFKYLWKKCSILSNGITDRLS